MNKILKINYSESVNNYNTQLTSKLRDFGEKNLQLWVPDEDIVLSILNMIFSVSQNDIRILSILLEKKDLSNKNLLIFKKLLSNFSSFEILENVKEYTLKVYKVQTKILEKTINNYNEENKDAYLINKVELNKKRKVNKINDNYKHDSYENIKQIKNLYSIHDNNKKFTNYIPVDLLKKLSKEPDYYISKNKNIQIVLKIVNGLIVDAKYNCVSNDFDKYYLDKYCNLICKLPIYEAYEHGVMKLEYFSRSGNLKKKIKGIITPLVTKKIFSNIQILMRDLWMFYCKKKKLKPSKNLFDKSPSKNWVSLDKNKKIVTIKKILDNFQKEHNVDCLIFDELNDDNIRVTLNFKDTNMSRTIDKSVILLKFEKYIRIKMERRIEIFYQELKDVNKLREKNTPI